MVWMWGVLGWVLLAVGVNVLAWALWWDRAGWRGRAKLRCRGCWYDLTGMVDELRGPTGSRPYQQVRCSECGKAHGSRRAVRRTRRRWGWAVVGLLLVVSAGPVEEYPKIRERGWWQAVPAWAMVLSMPRLPGSVADPDAEWESIAYGRSSAHGRAMGNLFRRERAGELGWVEYELAAWLARTETDEVLCRKNRSRREGVSPRAVAYGLLMESGIRRGRLGRRHERWYRRLVHVEAAGRARWPRGSEVYAAPLVSRAMSVTTGEHQLRLRFWPARLCFSTRLAMSGSSFSARSLRARGDTAGGITRGGLFSRAARRGRMD